MAFEKGVVPEGWRSDVIIPQDKGESNYSLLSMAGKIYVVILIDRVYKVTEGLINDEPRGFQNRGLVFKSDFHPKADR